MFIFGTIVCLFVMLMLYFLSVVYDHHALTHLILHSIFMLVGVSVFISFVPKLPIKHINRGVNFIDKLTKKNNIK